MCVLSAYSMVKEEPLFYFTSFKFPPTADNSITKPENSIPSKLNYTDTTVDERRISPPYSYDI